MRRLTRSHLAVLPLLALSCGGDERESSASGGTGSAGGSVGSGAAGGNGASGGNVATGGQGAVAGSGAGGSGTGGEGATGGTGGAPDAGTVDAADDGGAGAPSEPAHFLVLVRNTSSPDAGLHVVFGPGVFLVHSGTPPWFEAGQTATPGIERLAEDGMVDVALAEAEARSSVFAGFYGVDDLGVSYDESPIAPGTTADFEFDASPGDQLELGMMWSQSNDVFVATEPGGIALFDGSTPRTGIVTSSVHLWDAGTEVNQEPGLGDAQGPRQPQPNTGTAEGGTIAEIVNDTDASGFTYPSLDGTLEVEITVIGP